MEYNKIRELVERYWEGETSLEEEAALRSFFEAAAPGLPADLEEARPLFVYFAVEAKKEIPVPAIVVKMRPLQHWMKYAAVLLVALGVGYGAKKYQERQADMRFVASREDTFDDPDKAFAATQKALRILAGQLHKGTAPVQKLAYFSEVQQIIKEN